MRYSPSHAIAVGRARILLWALVVLGVSAGGAWARDMIGRGDFGFYLDTAAFRGRGDRVIAEVDVRIPNNEIRFKQSDDGFRARVKLSVLISDLEGKPVVQDAKEMEFTEPDEDHATSSLYFQTVIKRYHIRHGVYLLSYAVEDLESPKTTLMGRVQGKNQTSIVRDARLDLPEIPHDAPAFSQAKFLWGVGEAGEAGEGRREYHPNPPRVYGLYKDTLMVYMELYLPDSLAHANGFRFQSVVAREGGDEMAVNDVDLPNPGGGVGEAEGGSTRTYPILLRQDLARFPAGTYSLHVSFYLGDKRLSRIHAGNFSVAWDLRTWEVPRREMLAEARFLLGDKQFEQFRQRPPGDQERMLDELWKGADPTPETAANEAYEEFLRRLAFVNDHYGDGGPAVFDPRGQLYLRLGPPDDVVQDVIPLNRETAAEAVKLVEDPYYSMTFSTHGAKPYSRVTKNVVSDPRDLAGERAGDNVGYPFELWVYHASGAPLLERDRVKEIDIGMRYLFVDRDGYGRYKLESSSSISTK